MFIEIYITICWFNPVFIIHVHSLQLNHRKWLIVFDFNKKSLFFSSYEIRGKVLKFSIVYWFERGSNLIGGVGKSRNFHYIMGCQDHPGCVCHLHLNQFCLWSKTNIWRINLRKMSYSLSEFCSYRETDEERVRGNFSLKNVWNRGITQAFWTFSKKSPFEHRQIAGERYIQPNPRVYRQNNSCSTWTAKDERKQL